MTRYFSQDCVEFCENILFHMATDLALQTDYIGRIPTWTFDPPSCLSFTYLEGPSAFHLHIFSGFSFLKTLLIVWNSIMLMTTKVGDTKTLFSIFFFLLCFACVFVRIIILKSISGAVICTFWSVLDPAVTVKRLQILNRQCDVGFSGVFQTSGFLFIKTLWLYSIGEHYSVPESCRCFSCNNS